VARDDRDQRPETLSELFDLHRIELHGVIPKPGPRDYGGFRTKLLCPQCGGGRSKEKNFFIKVDPDSLGATWCCHRASCGYSGGGLLKGANPDRPRSPPKRYRRPEPPTEIHRPDPFLAYFAKDGITEETLSHFGVHRMVRRMPVLDADGKQTDRHREMPVIAYPYRDQGALMNCKYKAVYPGGHKRFVQETDAEPTLYNIDSFHDDQAGYFVEGENDCLAMFEAGIRQVTTIPNGTPPKLSEKYDPLTDEDERYIPVRPGDERIDRIKRWYLAGDMDLAGTRHMEEVARRLGKHRCWLVRWPAGCKDAYDTFRQGGKAAIEQAIANATRYPLEGVAEITEAMIEAMYARQENWRYTTGYSSLDQRLWLMAEEGCFCCTTGVPGHGKTAFWTTYAGMLTIRQEQCMRGNAALRPLHTVILSAEMPNEILVRNLISFHANKPFYPVKGRERVDLEEVKRIHLPWVRRNFTFLYWDKVDEAPTISWLIQTVRNVVLQTGAKLVIIDPWQEFDDEMPMSWRREASKWIGRVLRRLRGLALELKVNLVLIAHPVKMKRDRNGKFAVPGGYDVGESQAFSSVPYLGITIHRPNLGADEEADEMDVHCWKTRDGRYGRVGKTSCRFDQHSHKLYPRPTVAEAVAGMDAESA
jgi:twinkle protein